MKSSDIRSTFLDFFKKKGHTIVPSDSLVPSGDPTLLFTSAGMVPFKAHFLQQVPLTFKRAASSQRCLRTTDIDQVGETPRHLTFFEMLGNFSFGDYFKEEAISWGWEFLTRDLNLSEKRLWISIYKDDEESFKRWEEHVPKSRIVRMGEASNFWTMGPTGPCGPCSELYWDLDGKSFTKGPDDTDRWMEIWNLVFTQFDRQADGHLKSLPVKNIDTGMGLERLTSVVEGVATNFDTSLLRPLVQFAEDSLKIKYGSKKEDDRPLKIIADHLRAISFLVYDGIIPSNEGRGYVLRRLLRRAVRQGTRFGQKEAFLYKGVSHVVDLMRSTASDLEDRLPHIKAIIKQEEERFMETLESGSLRLHNLVKNAKNSKTTVISGGDVFRMYDTYGFPPELTKEILLESKMSFNEEEFNQAKVKAQELTREAWRGSGAQDVGIYRDIKTKTGPTVFRGYDTLSVNAAIKAIIKDGQSVLELNKGEKGEIITSESPFYPEGGGQVGDQGSLFSPADGLILAAVTDTQAPVKKLTVHIVIAKKSLRVDDEVEFHVDAALREPTMKHHTATHLLHAALKNVLNKSVTQAGSLVGPDRLRFDYSFNRPPSPEELTRIEREVNEMIQENLQVDPKVMPLDEARKLGAMALFGEKYGQHVRCLVIARHGHASVKDAYSIELCGGTHCRATGQIGVFKIISESSIGAGVRRLEAVAGLKAWEHTHHLEAELATLACVLRSTPLSVGEKVSKLLDRQKQLEEGIRGLRMRLAQGVSGSPSPEIREIKGIHVAIKVTEDLDIPGLRSLADQMTQRIQSGIVFAATTRTDDKKEKVSFVFSLTPDIQQKGFNAGHLAKKVAGELGGSGGGRSDFAQGGGQGKQKLSDLVKKLPDLIKNGLQEG